MTRQEFVELLKRLNLSQAAFARLLAELGEHPPAATTIWRWADGRSRVPTGVGALLRLLEILPEDDRSELLQRARGGPVRA
jgi:DNA-binding transcriptional regulator YiaG